MKEWESSSELIEDLGGRGEKLLASNLSGNEKVLAKLRGKFGQGLVVTDRHIYILKWGYMAGSMLGGRCIAYPYKNISSVKITKSIVTGIFQVVTPGNQDTKLSYWQGSANKADDAIAFGSSSFDHFQKASNLCRDIISEMHSS